MAGEVVEFPRCQEHADTPDGPVTFDRQSQDSSEGVGSPDVGAGVGGRVETKVLERRS